MDIALKQRHFQVYIYNYYIEFYPYNNKLLGVIN